MNNSIVTQEEQRVIFLDILDEVDAFCRKNDIRYSLSYGTLLGAVRHGGFIPWDDDVDISMPYPDMIRFKESFRSNKFKYCDVDTEANYEFPFSRVSFLPTFQKEGIIGKKYGVSIDLYPVVGCPESDDEVEAFFSRGKELYQRRVSITKLRNGAMKLLPISTIPGYTAVCRKYRDFVLQYPYENAKRYFHMGGPLKWYQVFDFDIFDNLMEMKFEDRQYLVTSEYHKYLTHVYGDYMTPPPEEKRHPYHGETIYKR